MRQTVSMTGWIVRTPGDPPIVCRVVDITDLGAGLALAGGHSLPGSFDLYLTEDLSVGRKCMVVWRAESTLGVCFTEKISPADEDRIDLLVLSAIRKPPPTVVET